MDLGKVLVYEHEKLTKGQYPGNNPYLERSLNYGVNLSKLSDVRFLFY